MSIAAASSAGCSCAPGESCTQWTGHGPPCSANEPCSGGCQSRVARTSSKRGSAASSFTRSAIWSPSGTESGPPGVKSFWKSTMTRASGMGFDNRTVPEAAELRDLLLTPEEAAQLDAPGSTDAAVLIPLYLDGGDLVAVFTERRDDLKKH